MGEGIQSTNALLELIDVFLQAISKPMDQPLLPEPQPAVIVDIPNAENHIALVDIQRKSTRQAKKVQSRVRKDALQIAQDLLTKKLGDLSHSTPPSSKANFESFSQHLDHPLNKTKMEAL